jgi:hypothetical protein
MLKLQKYFFFQFFIQLQYYRCAPLVSRYATPMASSPRSPLSPEKEISSPLTPARSGSVMQVGKDFVTHNLNLSLFTEVIDKAPSCHL